MVVTIQTASSSMLNVGVFEAMKYGLEAEPFADYSFDLTVQDLDKARAVAQKCNGKILTILERTEYPYYN